LGVILDFLSSSCLFTSYFTSSSKNKGNPEFYGSENAKELYNANMDTELLVWKDREIGQNRAILDTGFLRGSVYYFREQMLCLHP
jgi:hypothetical protein